MELGYVISPNYRRKGYCFEAIDNLVKLLFNDLHLDMIILGAIKENIPSLNLIKKLGFAYEGNKTKAFYHPLDGPLDVLYYKKERDES
jgi:RimJ/RimL family protein N-acetyltransferase